MEKIEQLKIFKISEFQEEIDRRNNITRTPEERKIFSVVTEHYSISISQMTNKGRKGELIIPRHILFYLFYKVGGMSLQEIGRRFNRTHATVIHGISKVRSKMDVNPKFKHHVNNFVVKIKSE